ncbi:hypothetical protein GCM10022233_07610 [Streptomyces shaanxiensis]|uniref:Uncharacterized protein n=1 Tax=Streptomyces shaanxiensis TaxID=653357 RepID=A0ABP7UE22_9ACTN
MSGSTYGVGSSTSSGGAAAGAAWAVVVAVTRSAPVDSRDMSLVARLGRKRMTRRYHARARADVGARRARPPVHPYGE